MDIKDILENLGFNPVRVNNGYRMARVYADGDNPSALHVYPNGSWIDFVESKRGGLKQLIQLSLGLKNVKEAEEWLQTKNINIIKIEEEPKLDEPQTLPIEWLNYLKPDHSYWIGRGISEKVMMEFKGGIATEQIPRMKGRYCLSVLNSKNQLVGLQGRSLDGKNPKYKIIGSKSNFMFPLHLNLKDIKNKGEVILVEGVGCVLSCFNCNIRQVMCLFGVNLSNYQLSTLISLNPNKIIISVNNDGAGLEAARKISVRLLKFFDKKQVEIKLPYLKDLNLILMQKGGEELMRMYA